MLTARHVNLFGALDAMLDRTMRVALGAAFFVLLLHWAVVVSFVYGRMGSLEFLRLHYTATQGVDWVGNWPLVFTFPGLGLGAFFLNLGIALGFARNRKPLAHVVLVATVVIELLLAAGGTIAVLLNG